MIIEINLWINPGGHYNGQVNINRGEQRLKFGRMISHERFLTQLTETLGLALSDLDESYLDPKSIYAFTETGFVRWNTAQAWIYYCNGERMIRVPMNMKYSKNGKYQPDISFRT
jgi:hypothetical protein